MTNIERGGHRHHHEPPIEGMEPNPCGGFNPNCPANPNSDELRQQLIDMREKSGRQGPPAGHPDFSDCPKRPCGQRKPRCPLMD